jgi:hypothetical protein
MSELTDYQTNAMLILAKAAKSRALGNELSGLFSWLSLPAKNVTYSGDDITVEPVPEVATFSGIERSQFTPEAIAKFEAKLLNSFRQSVYDRVRWLMENGYTNKDGAAKLAAELDLPVPTMVTHVEAQVIGIGLVNFALDGEVEKATVEAQLDTLVKDPTGDALRSVFPNVKGLPRRVSGLRVTVRPVWPDYTPAS